MVDQMMATSSRMTWIATFSDAFRRVMALSGERKYKEMLDLIEQILESELFPQEQKDYLLYFRAIGLDMTGNSLDALELFHSIHSRSLRANVVRSLEIVTSRLIGQLREMHSSDPADPSLARYEAILSELNFAPAFLTFEVRKQRIRALVQKAIEVERGAASEPDAALKESQLKNARDLRLKAEAVASRTAEAFLAISPHDPDYLRGSIELANTAGCISLRRKLLGKVHALFQARPFLTDLAQILEDFERGPEPAEQQTA